MLQVKIILGSTREGRFSEKVVPWLTAQLAKRTDMEAEVLDLRDYALPFYHSAQLPSQVADGNYGDAAVNKWADKIREADAFIIVTAEYNHGPAAVLKNALDLINAEWQRKAVAFVSYGSVGGARAVELVRLSAIELHMASTRTAVHIQAPYNLPMEGGVLAPDALSSYDASCEGMLAQLAWWGNALKEARAKGTY